MKALQNFPPAALIILSFLGIMGCNSVEKMQEKLDLMVMEATPNPLTTDGDSVSLTLKIDIPPKYFAKRAMVVVQPQLLSRAGGDSSVMGGFVLQSLKPVVLAGAKAYSGNIEVTQVVDSREGAEIQVTRTFPYQSSMKSSKLIANIILASYTESAVELNAVEELGVLNTVEKELAKGIIME